MSDWTCLFSLRHPQTPLLARNRPPCSENRPKRPEPVAALPELRSGYLSGGCHQSEAWRHFPSDRLP